MTGPASARCRAAGQVAPSGRRRRSLRVRPRRTCRRWNSASWMRWRDGGAGSGPSRGGRRARGRAALRAKGGRGHRSRHRARAAAARSDVDGDAEFHEPGDPGSNHCRGVCRSATEACSVGDALRQPDPDCEGTIGQLAKRLRGSKREVAVTVWHPGSCRSIHGQRPAVGVSRIQTEAHQIVPVDRDQDTVDVVPPVGASGDDRQREVELCVCGDDPRGEARHSR